MFEDLIGKSVRVDMNEPIDLHFKKGAKRFYGNLESEGPIFALFTVGHIDEPGKDLVQQALIDKDLIKSVKKDWLETKTQGKKEWFVPTKSWIPARDE